MHSTIMHSRLSLAGLLATLIMVVLIGRFFHIQIQRHDELLAKARGKYTSSVSVIGRRGTIYDSSHLPRPSPLAVTKVSYDLHAEIRNMGSRRAEVLNFLCRILPQVDRATLERRFQSGAFEVPVTRNLDFDVAERIRAEKSRLKLPGLRFTETQTRFYPKNQLAANILGFLGSDLKGVSGIERAFDKELTAFPGKRTFEQTARRVNIGDISSVAPTDGNNVYLTISEPLQSFVEEELNAFCEEMKCKAVYAIMADPQTGAILAAAQRPTFDPNKRSTITPEQFRNRLVEDGFEPGSTMKACSIATVLEKNPAVTLNTVFFCENGLWSHCGRALRDAGHKYANLPVWGIIQVSSNIGTAKCVLTIGPSMLYQGLRAFGFGERTGIGIDRESAGIFPKVENWSGLSLSRIAIGQGILVTPMQMIQSYCTIANGGQMMQLRLVDKVVDPVTGEVKREPYQPKLRRQVISEKTARAMAEAMKRVTQEGGTATKAAVKGYFVAGKTGTAQKVINGQYTPGFYVSSFIGFAPADKPRFVLLVVVDEPPRDRYYGGTVCGPVFSRIADKTLKFMNVPPDKPEELTPADDARSTPPARH